MPIFYGLGDDTLGDRLADIQALLAHVVEGMGFEFVGLEWIPYHNTTLLRAYVDGPEGVTVGDLALISRQLSGVLDAEGGIVGRYQLEVSSPGLDRPLFTAAHYQHVLGQEIKLRLKVKHNERRNFTGRLLSVVDDVLTLDVDGEQVTILLREIEKARLVPLFKR